MLNESKIALGTVQFGIDYGISSIDGQVQPKEVEAILNYAYVKGINLLDTAPAYGDSEQVLGKINVNNFKIITKTRHFDNSEITSNDLELLDQDFSRSLDNLKQEKKIEKIGVSIYDHNQLQAILENFDIDLVQLPFNILDRRLIDNGMLSILKNKGIEVHARSVFLQGLLLMSEQNKPDKFQRWRVLWKLWHEWLNDNQITALEATIRHAVSTSEISKVLVGVDTSDQLKGIITASSGALPDIPPEMFTNDVDLLNPSNWGEL